ncbi:PPE family protein [Nocardia vinacea]|uniref:PPE family protein n=1 Tax=Nocardia vinacea TaxID=96468 RepID=A0ABZ1Z0T0_9NOCA|nr:PPE domain-containing protein [Nocardia vinacea]
MIEPPKAGFTGVVWEARPTEQLAQDLTRDASTAPLTDAATGWSKLAASFGAAALDYDRIITTIRESWRSTQSEAVIARITTLRDWIQDAATAAATNATRVANQIVAYEVALAAMPHVEELAVLEETRRNLERLGALLGAPLVATAADTETEQDAAKAAAARIMRSYEEATEPLATAWQQTPPPVIVSDTAVADQEAGADQRATAQAGTGIPPMPHLGTISVPRAMTAYRTPVVTPVSGPPEPVPVQASSVQPDTAANRMAPAAMAPATAADAERTVRGGVASDARPGDAAAFEAGLQAAPAVLGVPEQAPPPAANSPDTSAAHGPGIGPRRADAS